MRSMLHAVLLALIGAKVVTCSRSTSSASPAAAAQTPPNFVIILTDDQDVTLDGMVPMTNTLSLLANAGVTFNNAFTSSPLCCPARASLLTGQYAHNHRTRNNSVAGGCYAQHWRTDAEPRSLPTHFTQRGYRTFYAGKYLNQYRGAAVPPGWSQWFGLNGNSQYYNYTLTENGRRRRYMNGEYLTDVLSAHAVAFLSNQTAQHPFLAIVTPPSAHSPFVPAPRHRDRFHDLQLLQTPNFNRASGELDKHWLLAGQQPAQLSAATLNKLRRINIRRWQTLLAVDEMVADIVHTLTAGQLLDNTYIVYTSDNGFHLGQFAQAADKRQPYETDIRVPLLMRGPGISPKTMSDNAVALIDVLPTLLELAGIEMPRNLDGVSFARQVTTTSRGGVGESEISDYTDDGDGFGGDIRMPAAAVDRQILVQHWGEGDNSTYEPRCSYAPSMNLAGCDPRFECRCQDARNNTYACLRQMIGDENLLYCEFADREDFAEAYDLNADPYQLQNAAYAMLPSMRNFYSMALAKLATCVGEGCQQIYN